VAEIRYLELPKMYQKWKAGEFKGATDPLHRWFLLLMATEDQKITQELEEIAMTDSTIEKAVNEWERLNQDPETRAIYRSRMMARMDQLSALKKAKREGKAEGLTEGIEKGKIETAKHALEIGVSLETIVKITGLDRETILQLQEKPDRDE